MRIYTKRRVDRVRPSIKYPITIEAYFFLVEEWEQLLREFAELLAEEALGG